MNDVQKTTDTSLSQQLILCTSCSSELKIILVKNAAWPTALNVEPIVCSYYVHNVLSIYH